MMASEVTRNPYNFMPREYIGMTSETSAFLSENVNLPDGSVYLELDGEKRGYILYKGVWNLV